MIVIYHRVSSLIKLEIIPVYQDIRKLHGVVDPDVRSAGCHWSREGCCIAAENNELVGGRHEVIVSNLEMTNSECFHFGSQSERTTTPGFQSDIDFLYSPCNLNIMTTWRDWKA
ncbi:hypothetical protein DPMN_144983 [Dreissena polymorpha]|uniref:Uncharacterized protein n=1 Tax=Dreissena polymorpha TaxID=45954 RepID=A0A9D4J0V6_DREPO|nr:hypothetical protein DPMN_144983 [Dreissena polymorpha]